MIFSAYRRDDFSDPEMFVMQLGTVLERYPDDVISEICHPLTGIQRRHAQPPAIAHVVTACEAAVEYRAKLDRLREMGAPTPRAISGRRVFTNRGNVLVHSVAPQYARMVQKAQSEGMDPLNWRWDDQGRGIIVPHAWLTEGPASALGAAADKVVHAAKAPAE